jgi:hypothetical protein
MRPDTMEMERWQREESCGRSERMNAVAERSDDGEENGFMPPQSNNISI